MVNLNELRRGNLLFLKSQAINIEIANPHGHFHISAWGVDHPIEDFEPIAITPEWLGRMGFEYSDYEECYKMPLTSELGIQHFRSYNGKEVVLLDGDDTTVGIPCIYVHQFQNRYFALTGEELTIKETV